MPLQDTANMSAPTPLESHYSTKKPHHSTLPPSLDNYSPNLGGTRW
jgi:hypothetical protein